MIRSYGLVKNLYSNLWVVSTVGRTASVCGGEKDHIVIQLTSSIFILIPIKVRACNVL